MWGRKPSYTVVNLGRRDLTYQPLTLRRSFRKASLIPPDIEPTNTGTTFGGGENCWWCNICCWCANAPIEGPWPNEGKGCRIPRPSRLGAGCISFRSSSRVPLGRLSKFLGSFVNWKNPEVVRYRHAGENGICERDSCVSVTVTSSPSRGANASDKISALGLHE